MLEIYISLHTALQTKRETLPFSDMGGGASHERETFEYHPPNLVALSTLVSISVHSKRTRRARLALTSPSAVPSAQNEKDLILRQESSTPSEEQLQRLLSNTLKRLFLLDELTDNQLEQLIASLRHENYNRDTIIISEGDHERSSSGGGGGGAAYIIERGEVEVLINKTTIRRLGQGELFGELGLLFQIPRTATIRTTTFCSLYLLEQELYQKIQKLSNSPPISQRYQWLLQCAELKVLSPLQMSRLFLVLKRVRFERGEELYQEHEAVDRVILIESGEVEIVLTPSLRRHLPKRFTVRDVDRALGVLRPAKSQSGGADERERADQVLLTLNRSDSEEQEAEGESVEDGEGIVEGDFSPPPSTFLLSAGCIVGIPLLRVFSDQKKIGLWDLSSTPIAESEDLDDVHSDPSGEDGRERRRCPVLSPMTLISRSALICSVFTVNSYRRLFQSSSSLSSSRRPSEATLLANSKLVTFDPSQMSYLTVLGEGGFGKVLLGSYHAPSPPCSSSSPSSSIYTAHGLYAVKFLSKASIQSSGNYHRVLNERKLLAAFHSPFIISLYGTFQTPTALAFVMEVLDHGDLWSILYENDEYPNGLPPDLIRFYTATVVYGLAHMHGLGVVYRDLKPENLMVNSRGYVKLIDCGLAKKIPYEETDCYGIRAVKHRSYSICGTPG
jgi:CRP-like cAMP-binding protein